MRLSNDQVKDILSKIPNPFRGQDFSADAASPLGEYALLRPILADDFPASNLALVQTEAAKKDRTEKCVYFLVLDVGDDVPASSVKPGEIVAVERAKFDFVSMTGQLVTVHFSSLQTRYRVSDLVAQAALKQPAPAWASALVGPNPLPQPRV